MRPRSLPTITSLCLGSLTLAAACNKTPEPALENQATPKPAPLVDTSFRRPAAERVVAIGDLHGDLQATRAALELAGALGQDDHWAGGKMVVVQTGDQLDRGDDEPEILDLLERLAVEAEAAGGALYALNGNHEMMNVQADFRYVTEDGFRDFAETPHERAAHEREIRQLPAEQRGRAAAFLPGEAVAKRLAKRPAVIQIGSSVFVHGGLLEAHVEYGLGRINRELQQWMEAPQLRPAPAILNNDQSPLWLRLYSDGAPSREACAQLTRILERLEAKRLVVGHTVQQAGINSACNGQVWRIDVGLSRHYGRNPISVLELMDGQTRVIQAPRPAPRTTGSAAPVAPSSSSPGTLRPASSAGVSRSASPASSSRGSPGKGPSAPAVAAPRVPAQ